MAPAKTNKKGSQPEAPTPLSLEEMALQLQNERQEMTTLEFQTMMVHHMIQFGKVTKDIEKIEQHLTNHEGRIKALEDKIGGEKEFPIPLTIVMQNLPPSQQFDDTQMAKKVIEKLKIEGVSDSDVTRAFRQEVVLGFFTSSIILYKELFA